MAKAGDSLFNRVLKESGGYVLDNKDIKYILANPLPDNLRYAIKYPEIKIEFALVDNSLKSRLHIYLYESSAYNGFMTKNLKYIGFFGKVYVAIHKQPVRRVNQIACFHIVLDETK